jgi:hypothetical protein
MMTGSDVLKSATKKTSASVLYDNWNAEVCYFLISALPFKFKMLFLEELQNQVCSLCHGI